ncbi:MAG: SWF/SNF helicase family protein [Gemmatimonadetes bacterium]|nr:SWF/SNF helicase family protein [Gemmatimonadota bacterium]
MGDVHLEEAAAEEAEDEVADSESLQTGAGKIGGAPILDAFSPFYQVDLPPLTDGAGKLDSVRKRLAAALEQPVRVLLATEVLAEGVNLQQSGILIHYDLPWNPTRLIQRNGRVDRRINALVENPTSLERYLEGLGLADPKAAAASYVIPLKVFHFTVPPIEATALDAEVAKERAQRVRAVLAAKLDSIRRILGLSSWPVVLDQATATAVLDGSLEYETPSLVRRERLLQRVRQLEASTAAARDAGVTATSGTITLKISRDDLGHLARTVVGEPADWSRLRALVLTTWSPRYPRSTPLRSAHEWYATQETGRSGNRHDIGGMMPILLFADNALTWIPHTYTGNARSYKKTLLPVSWDKADYVFLRPVDLTPTTDLVIPEAMSSPAALFDVVLDWLAELALGRSEVFVDRIHIDPPSDRPWAWLGEELARQPPTMLEIEPGDVGAALRRPHADLIQGTPAATAETFAADKLESFNLVITP